MKKSEDVQLPLFSNAEFSSSIPSRATSKQENDFIVIIRNEIQNFVKNGGDYSKPIVLNIDLKRLPAKEVSLAGSPYSAPSRRRSTPSSSTPSTRPSSTSTKTTTCENGPTGCCHTSTRTPSRASSRLSSIRTSKSTT